MVTSKKFTTNPKKRTSPDMSGMREQLLNNIEKIR